MSFADYFWTPTGSKSTFNLREVIAYHVDPNDADKVLVRFTTSPNTYVTFDKADFEAAYQVALDA